MNTVCELNKCTGCMACIDSCPVNAITIRDSLKFLNSEIDDKKCINCKKCERVCQINETVQAREPIVWYQGWANKIDVRKTSASGGLASAIIDSFICSGGYVCSCHFEKGQFIFSLINKQSESSKFRGSKYVKSNPVGIYKQINKLLQEKAKVLFIGLPCQCAAVLNYNKYLKENLYTIDLICHGSPSSNILGIYLKEHGYDIDKVNDVSFRVKGEYFVSEDKNSIEGDGICDAYTTAFLNGLTYTENCYECEYAKRERIADMTLGDSWGSELPIIVQKAGVSLILCNTEKGKWLLNSSNVNTMDVNVEKAIAANHQLVHPSMKPEFRDEFFEKIKSGQSFTKTVYSYYPKQKLKNMIKKTLIKLYGKEFLSLLKNRV